MSYKEEALDFLGMTRWHELGKKEQTLLFFFYTKNKRKDDVKC